MAMTGKVVPAIGANVRKGAGIGYAIITALTCGTTITIDGSAKDTNGATWYTVAGHSNPKWYISGSTLKTSGSLTPPKAPEKGGIPPVPPNSVNVLDQPKISNKPTPVANKTTTNPPIATLNASDKLKKDYWKYARAMGAPPMYNKNIDLQYIDDICSGCGRIYATTMLENPSIISLCPGKVNYLPSYSKDKKKTITDQILKAVGNAEFAQRCSDEGAFNGQLYDFIPEKIEYGNVFNVLCRAAAMFMDVGDDTMTSSGIKLKNFDYGQWTYPSQSRLDAKDSFFGLISGLAQAAVDDSSYMHYFISSGSANVTENISTGTEKSVIETALSGSNIDNMARNINYLFGGVASAEGVIGEAQSEMEAMMSKYNGSMLGNIGIGIGNYLKGGRMVFPEMVGDITYGKQINANLHFTSPYGSKKSIFLYCIVPVMSLLAMALPKQISDNMYTYPFIVRVYQPGQTNSDLAVITDMKIERGGQEDTSWTVDGIATEWDVSLSIQPLYNNLMTTSARNPMLFMNNGALIEYIGNLCGVDLKANNIQSKIDLIKAMVTNKFTDIPANMAKGATSWLTNQIAPFLQWHS